MVVVREVAFSLVGAVAVFSLFVSDRLVGNKEGLWGD